MKNIYLDYAATTPVDPRVVKAMLPYFSDKFGNTMSLHSFGQTANEAVEYSRKVIADYIHAKPDEIIFTSSATESNNLALKGVMYANKLKGINHLIVSTIEHDCIMESARWLSRQGFKVTWIPVDKYGFVDIKKITNSITKETAIVSIIHGNNEIGTIQDVKTIGKICREKNVYFHTDASQTLGKELINVDSTNIDLMTLSSHKVYGPKGVACLYVRKGINIEPIIHGGGHEKGLRSSTTNVAGIIGFGKAVKILAKDGMKENKRLIELRDFFIKEILTKIKNTRLNGHPTKRLSNNINISFHGVEGESLLLELDFNGVAVSTGSACSSKTLMPSHVLTAIGLPPQEAHGSLRISLGRSTTKQEIIKAVKILEKVVKKYRNISPFK